MERNELSFTSRALSRVASRSVTQAVENLKFGSCAGSVHGRAGAVRRGAVTHFAGASFVHLSVCWYFGPTTAELTLFVLVYLRLRLC